ncbi:MAG: hypothetical protein U9N14_05020 [Pseudomonadota bacterium]|nr:hypothetical protein [Pseudomonadota bacterium]
MSIGPDIVLTVLVMLVAICVFVLGIINENRPYAPGKMWRFPWLPVMFVSMLVVMIMAGHLISLITGNPFRGRRSLF